MNIDLAFVLEVFPQIAKFVYITLLLTIIAVIFGIIWGLVLAFITKNKVKMIYPLANAYISWFRGTPMLVQLFILYYGLPQLFPQLAFLDAFTAVVIALILKNGAYFSEAFRGAITSVEKGQLEACLSIGMTKWQGTRMVVLPQATRVAIPAMGNVVIQTVKDTSLAFLVGIPEMLANAKIIASTTYKYLEAYLAVGIAYWILTMVISFLQERLEERMERPYR